MAKRRDTAPPASPDPMVQASSVHGVDIRSVPPAWGWRHPGGGRLSHVTPIREYQGTSVQACGLYPFVAGSGAPAVGVPFGRHLMWGEVVCLDPFAWLDHGLVTNTGIFVLGQPGTGKSAGAKRLMRGLAAFGVRPFVLGDTKPDYVGVVAKMGGQIIRPGRGLDQINPLDSGPLGRALAQMSGPAAERLRFEVRGRRLASLLALCSLVRRHHPVSNGEEVVLGTAVDLLLERNRPGADPIVPDVLALVREGPERLVRAAEVRDHHEYLDEVKGLCQTLNLLCEGSLQGVFDGPTSRPIDLDAPAVCVDISNLAAAGDTLVSAAMLSTWAYGFGMVDAASALFEAGLGPRRHYFVIMDELWRALRGAPGLVEHADALTRLNRSRGMGHMMLTHSLADLDALPTDEDRAKARGFAERCGIVVLTGLPPKELDEVTKICPLSAPERDIVSSWSAPESWQPGTRHPGRGKYLIKTGQRIGIPVDLEFVADEAELYNTDHAVTRNHLRLVEGVAR